MIPHPGDTLTIAQKREIEILKEMRFIYTMGYGIRHALLKRMAEKGLIKQDAKDSNRFTLE